MKTLKEIIDEFDELSWQIMNGEVIPYKTDKDWAEEAASWIDNWDGVPTYDQIEGECYHIEGIQNPKSYAKTLWGYIVEDLRKRGYDIE